MVLVKIFAFACMLGGALFLLGMLAVSAPSTHHQAFSIGENAISYLQCLGVASIAGVIWIASKIK